MHAQMQEDSNLLGAAQPLTNMVTILLATSLIVQLDVLLRLLVRFLVIYFKLMKNKVNWY